jgi:hypothetical protein
MIIATLLVGIFRSSVIGPVWQLPIKFALYTLGIGLLQADLIWSKHERDFQKPANNHTA